MPDHPTIRTKPAQPIELTQSIQLYSLQPYTMPAIFVGLILFVVIFNEAKLRGQDAFKDFNATQVFRDMNAEAVAAAQKPLVNSWWDRHVQNSLREVQPLPTDLHTILYLAVHHSNQIKIAKADPLIRETAIQEADSAFDWVRYLNTAWNDTSEPVSNSLTVGGNQNRFNDTVFQGTGGARRTTRSGGQLDISQRFGWQDNNSQFFIPNDQATGRLTMSYTHPLMRGRGAAYNNAIVFLAQVDTEVANNEFLATLQDELLEITRAYWNLHLERAVLAHQLRLYLRTKEIYQTLSARQTVDTQGTQLILAASALENRRADLIRAQTAVTNSETRLRGMINAQELGNSDQMELIPVEPLPTFQYHTDLQNEIQIAIQNRPEVRAAVQQVKAGSLRLGVAQHELMPVLNLVTQGYLSGLQGDSDFGEAFTDQFSVGRPSYSVGLQYELPVGNRLAKARVCRRQHELERLQSEYARALQAVQTEVDIAVRELNTSRREITAKSRALAAAEAEVTTIEQRWQRMIDGSGTSSLNLESLLRAQERVTAAEREYVTARLTYSLAMVNMKRANGTLLQSEAISVSPSCNGQGCNDIVIDKAQSVPMETFQMVPQAGESMNIFTGQAPAPNLNVTPTPASKQWDSVVVNSDSDEGVRVADGSFNADAGPRSPWRGSSAGSSDTVKTEPDGPVFSDLPRY
ncbi:TolC family protein [Mariniblastus fucicola]|uniref:Outer membrane efflux protein n=1 Tax=Mariniblastus fucicola TaxID=980251 RepID=A0A5B9PFK1_9BACT|nr:TolC family protein [Mariniblastus fucicola]QEG24329.1 Outer membrane efflux protein [Mariniblastus fucicola]